MCDGRLFSARTSPRPLRDATLTQSGGPEKRRDERVLGDDLGGDLADAGAGQADGTGRARGKVEHAPLDEGTAVVDGNDDALAAVGHPQLGAERQRAVGAGHGVLVEASTRSGLAAGFVAVEGSHSGEA